MGVAIAHGGQQADAVINFKAMFGALRIAAAFTLVSGFSPQLLLLVSKLKKMARWKEIHVE